MAGEMTGFGQVLEIALQIVFPILALVAAWGVAKGIKWYERKTKHNISEDLEWRIERWVEKSIGFAEQYAKKKLAENKETLSGPKKLEAAINFGATVAKQYSVPEWAQNQLEDLIEAKLGAHTIEEKKMGMVQHEFITGQKQK